MFTIKMMGNNDKGENYEWVISAKDYTKRLKTGPIFEIEMTTENTHGLQMLTVTVGGDNDQIHTIFVENSSGKTIDRISAKP